MPKTARGGVERKSGIGATDAAVEGSWVWVTGEPWSYTAWETNEPNASGNCLWTAQLSASKTINTGDTFTLSSSSLTITNAS